MRNWPKLLVPVAGLLCCAVTTAQSSPRAERPKPTKQERGLQWNARCIDREAGGRSGGQRVLTEMSSQLGVRREKLKRQKEDGGLIFGDLLIATSLAKASVRSFEDIVAARDSGKDWGQIAKENNVRLGGVANPLKRSSGAIEAAWRSEQRRATLGKESPRVQGIKASRGKVKNIGKHKAKDEAKGKLGKQENRAWT